MDKYIILGDVHLGKGLGIGKPAAGNRLNSRIQDQLDLLDWVLQTAISNKVTNIIITGDIYEEPRPHPALIQFFMFWLKKCEKENINIHIIVGNHDIVKTGAYTVSALDIIPAVELPFAHIYKDVATVNFNGISFTFVPYRDRRMYDAANPDEALSLLIKEIKDEPAKMSAGNMRVMVGHLALKGALYVGDEIDDMLNEIFCPLSMFKEWEYVWMGHIHKPQVMLEKPFMAHIGSMDRSNFDSGELDYNKHIVLIDPTSEVKFQQITIPTRTLRKIEIDVPEGKDTTDFLINELFSINAKESLKENIVRIEIKLNGAETPNADRDKVSKFLYEKMEIHHIAGFSESRILAPIISKKQTLFEDNVSIKSATDTFISNVLQAASEDEKNLVMLLAHECIDELLSKKAEKQ